MLYGIPQFFREDLFPVIIDIHTHTFPDKIASSAIAKLQSVSRTWAFSDGTNAGLSASMARAGVDCSVILPVATSAKQVVHINDSAIRLNERFPETGLLSFGCMHPDFEDWHDELSRIAAQGIKGIKIHPAYQAADLDDIRYLRVLARAAEVGLVVLAHAGVDIGLPDPVYSTPEMALHIQRELGNSCCPLILAHMGGWRQWNQVEHMLAETPFYLDTAFSYGSITPMDGAVFTPEEKEMMGQEQFLRFIAAFGARRLLFGTDSPWGDQSADMARIRTLPISEEEKAAILGGNAQALLEL